MTAPDSTTFLRAIELTEVAPQTADRAYTAVPQYVPWPKAYGGDAVAAATAAATATVDEDRRLVSVHGSFLRPIEVGVPVRYEVELLRDGRSYSTRQVRGSQGAGVAFLATVSFQVPEDGPQDQPAAPPVRGPSELGDGADEVAGLSGPAADYWSRQRSFEHRHVQGHLYSAEAPDSAARQEVWIRAFDRLPDDPSVHRLALAYLCDYSILEPSLRRIGVGWLAPGLTTASLDHAMWLHRDARADGWLLYAQETAGIQSGRALNVGRFFDEDGTLIATIAQEGMIRIDPAVGARQEG